MDGVNPALGSVMYNKHVVIHETHAASKPGLTMSNIDRLLSDLVTPDLPHAKQISLCPLQSEGLGLSRWHH